MAGCVSITASCNKVSLFSAIVIGFIGSLLYTSCRKLYQRFEIDDPCEASIVHGICGFWGILAVGIFNHEVGLVYTGNFKQLGIQLFGGAVLATWSVLITLCFIYIAKKGNRYRVGEIYEIVGTDILDPHDPDLKERYYRQQIHMDIKPELIHLIEQRQRDH